jgi:mono/diheme cytochrome c family protein
MRRSIGFLVCAALALAAAPALRAQEMESGPPAGRGGRGGRGGGGRNLREFLGLGPAPDQAAAKKGEPLYQQNCATCHGDKGRGAQAPNLLRSVVVLHDEKGNEIGPVVKNGRPQAGMPAFASLSTDDLYDISEYLHWQVELAANRGTYSSTYAGVRNQTSGDPRKGAEFFNTSCSGCHSATGDLAKIGQKYGQAAVIQSRFLWPATPGPAKAKVTTASGEIVTGTVRSLTDYDVSLIDGAGAYRYWPRASVKVEVEDKLAGHRALLPKYTDADIHNLTAYLETLK